MKKAIFLMGVTAFYFVACTSSKENIKTTSTQDYYKNNSYAQPYLNDPHLISGELALAYIHEFRKHTYKGWRKKKLLNPWSRFDPTILNQIVSDPNIDSIFFFLAAYLKNAPDSLRKHPFVILQAIPKPTLEGNGKGSATTEATISKPLYFTPIKICPPPNTGCLVPRS